MTIFQKIDLLLVLLKIKQKFDVKIEYKYVPELYELIIVVKCPSNREVSIIIEQADKYDFANELFYEYIQHYILKFWLTSLQRL